MDKNAIKNRIEKLREEISRLRFLYHVDNDPNVTDDVYESLTRELYKLEKENPEFSDPNSSIYRVAGEPLPSFKKVKHEIRMLSMNDTFSEDEVSDWEKRVLKILGSLSDSNSLNYFCEIKLDGLSASLIYENGIFVRGATRGDGFIGEDITENLKMIDTIPLKLLSKGKIPSYLEIRGEVVMPKRAWRNLNKIQEANNLPLFANTRNAAAGSLRQLDPSIVKNRKLEFFAWDIASMKNNGEEIQIENHSDKHEVLRDFGFSVTPYEKKVNDMRGVFDFIKEVGKIRENLPFGTDGMVVCVDNLDIQKTLGIVGKAPRYMVAYKYPAERATTIITDIKVNVGRTGVLTPVAHFNPTLVAGSTVSKATLHNMDQINRLDIRIGDTVVIQKAGDVIPEVVEVLSKMRTGKERKFKMSEFCPVCNSNVERRAGNIQSSSSQGPRTRGAGAGARPVAHKTLDVSNSNTDSVAYYCTNKHCTARNSRSMQHFVNVFEIYEIGPKILDRLKDEGLISDSADLFTLEKVDLSGLERFGEKSADNIISSIENHKKISLWRFIYALGIIHVGEQTARDLADHFYTLDKLKEAKLEDLNNIDNIGPKVSESIFNYFKDKSNLYFLDKLLKNGVSIIEEQKKTKKLSGKTFVLTGTLPSLSREEAKKRIIENGGKVSSSVSIKTDYVLAGEEAGSKYKEAQKLGVKILTEEDFLKML